MVYLEHPLEIGSHSDHSLSSFSLFKGHLRHARRAIFQDIWTGVTFESQANKNMVDMKSQGTSHLQLKQLSTMGN